jgi:hypothetical protein
MKMLDLSAFGGYPSAKKMPSVEYILQIEISGRNYRK